MLKMFATKLEERQIEALRSWSKKTKTHYTYTGC
jgi:hypothetical protein